MICVDCNCWSSSAISGLLQAAPESGDDCVEEPLEEDVPLRKEDVPVGDELFVEFISPMALSLFSLLSSVEATEVFGLANRLRILFTSMLLSLKGTLLDLGVEVDSALNGLTVGVFVLVVGNTAFVH